MFSLSGKLLLMWNFVDGENFHNFADDNTLSDQADSIEELVENLQYLSEVAIDWIFIYLLKSLNQITMSHPTCILWVLMAKRH